MNSSVPTKLAAAATAAAACLLVPTVAIAAGIGGFSVRPARVNPAQPVTRSYFKPAIARGGAYRNQVIVTNSNAKPVELFVNPVDGLTGVTSGAVYANRQKSGQGTARWVHPAVREVRVPGHGQRSVAFVVRIPADATPGEHLAGLAFQNAHPKRAPGKFSITEIVRAVIGVDISVPGPAQPSIQLHGLALRALPGTAFPSVVINLGNAGRQLCQPRLAVVMTGPGGTLRVVRQLDTILPGDAIPYPLAWPRPLAAGRYIARVTATRCGASATMTRAATLGTALRGTHADPNPKAPASKGPPWVVIFVGLAGLGLGGLFAQRRRTVPKAL